MPSCDFTIFPKLMKKYSFWASSISAIIQSIWVSPCNPRQYSTPTFEFWSWIDSHISTFALQIFHFRTHLCSTENNISIINISLGVLPTPKLEGRGRVLSRVARGHPDTLNNRGYTRCPKTIILQ